MSITPLTILIFLLVFAICGGLAALISSMQNAARKKRIGLVRNGTTAHHDQGKSQDHRRADIAGKLKNDKQLAAGKKNTIGDMIAQAGLSISVKQYWIYAILFACGVTCVLFLIEQPPFVVVCGGLSGLLGVPKLMLSRMAADRQKKFLEDFPDALEAVVRLLKAGMPVSEAVAMSAREFSGPVAEEMAHIHDQQKIGVPLHDAAYEACKRIPITEMNMFATSLAIQAQTGSSLSEVLMNLSSMIRSRFRLKRKVKALSSEAIASAGIIGALPVLVAGGMYLTNKEYISILFTDSFGQVLLSGAVIWMGLGILTMKIMINFKV